MPNLACPYCYQRFDARKMWFRCAGRGSPGFEPCKPQDDPARARETGITETVLPSFNPAAQPRRLADLKNTGRVPTSAICPTCHGSTGVRVCPTCHTQLPATFGEGDSPLIAVVGAKGTGKSVYLKVLAHELRHDMRRRFGADVRLSGDSQFAAENQADFLDPAGDLFPTGRLYNQTSAAQGGRKRPVVVEWRQKRRTAGFSRFETTYLSFFDTAGEDLGTQQSASNLRYLGAADALILLLDPFMIKAARHSLHLPPAAIQSGESTVDVVNRVTENLRISHRLGSRKNIKIPVAVAFAKIDAFFDLLGADHPLVRRPAEDSWYDETAGRATHEHVRALLYDWKADDIDAHLDLNYTAFRYFAVSALGAEPDYERNEVDERGVQPFRVDEPLLWLLSRFGVVPRRETPR